MEEGASMKYAREMSVLANWKNSFFDGTHYLLCRHI